MKKQHLKSLALKKNIVAHFTDKGVVGGRTGGACVETHTCPFTNTCPQTVVHTCQLTDVRTCSLSVIYCTA